MGREENSVIYKLFYTWPPLQILLGERVNRSREGAGCPRRLQALHPSLLPALRCGARQTRGVTEERPGDSLHAEGPSKSRLLTFKRRQASLRAGEQAGKRCPLPPPESPCPRGGSAGREAERGGRCCARRGGMRPPGPCASLI